jgi:hypothetical protein
LHQTRTVRQQLRSLAPYHPRHSKAEYIAQQVSVADSQQSCHLMYMHTYRRALYTLWSEMGIFWIWGFCHQLRHWAIVYLILFSDSWPCSTTINSRGQHLNSRNCFSQIPLNQGILRSYSYQLFGNKQNLSLIWNME